MVCYTPSQGYPFSGASSRSTEGCRGCGGWYAVRLGAPPAPSRGGAACPAPPCVLYGEFTHECLCWRSNGMPRYFTRAEAEALLPRVEPLLREMQALRAELAAHEERLARPRVKGPGNGPTGP